MRKGFEELEWGKSKRKKNFKWNHFLITKMNVYMGVRENVR